MTITEIKNRMYLWEDFYGQDIAATDMIKKAKTKEELYDVLKDHRRFLEYQNIDAITHCDDFIKFLGVNK